MSYIHGGEPPYSSIIKGKVHFFNRARGAQIAIYRFKWGDYSGILKKLVQIMEIPSS